MRLRRNDGASDARRVAESGQPTAKPAPRECGAVGEGKQAARRRRCSRAQRRSGRRARRSNPGSARRARRQPRPGR
eukprot:678626-Alexandrium_andersonii.AAC.1